MKYTNIKNLQKLVIITVFLCVYLFLSELVLNPSTVGHEFTFLNPNFYELCYPNDLSNLTFGASFFSHFYYRNSHIAVCSDSSVAKQLAKF